MSLALPRAVAVKTAGNWSGPADRVTLSYEGRFLRRKRLAGESGAGFVVDLPETVSLDDGDALVLEDGGLVEVVAADEPLMLVEGENLARLAWHVGNRHTPCEIAAGRLVLRADHVLAQMLRGLGARVTEATGPFRPEGGAYGMGRTMGHSHGHDAAHAHPHGAGHDQAARNARAHLSAGDFDGGE